jgi:hypothetical protein
MFEQFVARLRHSTQSDFGAAAPDQFVAIGGQEFVQHAGTLAAAPYDEMMCNDCLPPLPGCSLSRQPFQLGRQITIEGQRFRLGQQAKLLDQRITIHGRVFRWHEAAGAKRGSTKMMCVGVIVCMCVTAQMG